MKSKKGKNLKLKKKRTPLDHPMWNPFQEYIENGIHFNTIPLDCGEPMTMKNSDEWMPYWNTYIHGILVGRDQITEIQNKSNREEVERKWGK